MDKNKLQKYAEVVVKRGVYLQHNQVLYIEADIEAAEFVREVVAQAYLAGAKEVGVRYKDRKLDLLNLLNKKGMKRVSGAEVRENEYYSNRRAAYLNVETPDFDVNRNVPMKLLHELALQNRLIRQAYIKRCKRIQNCIICVPCGSWAEKVYPELRKEDAIERLWEDVFFCMRLEEPDPVAAWDKFVARTQKRRMLLNHRNYKELHFKSSETDLTVCPIDNACWYGGCSEMGENRYYIPNMPTEEVFTVPNKYKVNGFVTSTRPLNYKGMVCERFQLKIKDGKVISCEAETGAEVLRNILETDEGSCYFGEIALIDKNSPIARKNTIFYTTLYDENASCHMALGFGLAGEGKTEAERETLGINTSSIHVDFMIGSGDMSVRGLLENGEWEDILIDGRWSELFMGPGD